MINLKEVSEGDILLLVEHARDLDIEEVAALTPASFESAVRQSIKNSDEVAAAYIDGDLVCIFGLHRISMLTNKMAPWMLGTKFIEIHKRQFYKGSKKLLARMLEHADQLENMVYCDHYDAVNWLGRIGFKFGKPVKYGHKGKLFMRFYLCAQY